MIGWKWELKKNTVGPPLVSSLLLNNIPGCPFTSVFSSQEAFWVIRLFSGAHATIRQHVNRVFCFGSSTWFGRLFGLQLIQNIPNRSPVFLSIQRKGAKYTASNTSLFSMGGCEGGYDMTSVKNLSEQSHSKVDSKEDPNDCLPRQSLLCHAQESPLRRG